MYILELYNGLAWDDPAENKKARTGSFPPINKERTGNFDAPADDVAWAPFENKDHFQVLGLHWSSSRGGAGPAYKKLRSDSAPAGIKRPSNSGVAEKISKRLDEAYKVLNDPGQRRSYRRSTYNL